MSGDKVPSGTSPLSVPLVPSVKARPSISFRELEKKKVTMWNFGIHRKNLRVWKLKGKDALPSQ